MTAKLTWDKDPIVLLEREITPVLWLPFDILSADGDVSQDDLDQFRDRMQRAATLLQTAGAEMLAPTGAVLVAEDQAICRDAAKKVLAVAEQLGNLDQVPPQPDRAAALIADIQGQMRPAVLAAMDAFRRVFISMVLEIQSKQSTLSSRSMEELESISKQIFFVAINASVEAARIGDAGAGFAHIGREIKALSETAQGTIAKMKAER